MHPVGNKYPKYLKVLCSIMLCSIFVGTGALALAYEGYSQSAIKDPNTDAPWRVQNKFTAIPFVFALADVYMDALEELIHCKIWLIQDMNDRSKDKLIYFHDFHNLRIDRNTEGSINGNWEWNVSTFENSSNSLQSDGLEITPDRLGYPQGSTLFFQTEIQGKEEVLYIGWKTMTFRKVLKVQVGNPLPKPGADWYNGDTHYHTEYTNNPYEYGGTLASTKKAIKAMGLDWITATDHASNAPDSDFFFGRWDLSAGAWSNQNGTGLKDRASKLNAEGGPLILVGEEVTCDAGADPNDGIHLLVYNNDNFIDGEIDNTTSIFTSNFMNPKYSLSKVLSYLKDNAFAYGAHPFTNEDVIFGLHDIIERWNDQDYSTAIANSFFSGLEIWNTRVRFEDNSIDDNNVNPFNSNGEWPENTTSTWLNELNQGVTKWDELMRAQLPKTPLRKIFIEGGSDAHGDLNYVTSGAGSNIDQATDNAVGKVRTLVYAPQGMTSSNIFSALKNGRSVVTDGPVCIFGIDNNNDDNLNDAGKDTLVGDHVTLPVGKDLELLIKWASTDDFGNIDEIQIWRGSESSTQKVDTIITKDYQSGSYKWNPNISMKPGAYYYRIVGIVNNHPGSGMHRCFSNPIWVTWVNQSMSKVPDTGQTICYDVAGNKITCPSPGQALYGQDANYTINPMSYTKLDSTGQALPDSAKAWSMVKDNVTGLIWEVKTNIDGVKNYNDPHDADNGYTWYDSNPATNGGYAGTPGNGTDTEDFIKALNDAHFGGYNDWRLPTVKELAYIVDYSIFNYNGPMINTVYFPDMVSFNSQNIHTFYWSSSTYAKNMYIAWLGSFQYWHPLLNTFFCPMTDKNDSWYARAVRGGQFESFGDSLVGIFDTLGSDDSFEVASADNYKDNGDGTVTDLSTELMWQQNSSSEEMTWEKALAYCEGLNLGGHTDWRLPNIKELGSLADYTRYNPAINTAYFPKTVVSEYWSSTTNEFIEGCAWDLSFDIGYGFSLDNKTNSSYVRAVRGGQFWTLSNLSIFPPRERVQKGAGSTTFGISNTGTGTMPWTATVTAGGDWLSISTGASGTNTGTITCAYKANASAASRTGTIRVTATGASGSPKNVTVVQDEPDDPVISGSVKTNTGAEMSGVTIAFSNNGGTATTDSSGNYSRTMVYGYSGTATPSKSGYTFSPTSRTYTNVTANQTNHNYTGNIPSSSRAQFLGIWSDGVWIWDKPTNKWTLISSTSNVLQIAAGKVDTDSIDDLIGVWPSGLYVRQSGSGQSLKLSALLPTWIAVGDLNNDDRDDVIATWTGSGLHYWNSASGTWVKLYTTPAKQLASGNLGGTRDDLAAVFNDGLWVRYSADGSWKKIDAGIPIWITVCDMTGDERADIVGSYSTGTWCRNSANGSWTNITLPAEQLAAGDIDCDGRDDLVGIWFGAVWVKYGATGLWQQITPSKPKWITTGRMAAAIQAAGSLDDPMATGEEVIDLSKEWPDEVEVDIVDSVQQ